VFTLSTGRIVHETICLERNYIKTDEDSVFTRSHAEFLLSFSIDQSFNRLSKLVRDTGTLENLNLAVNLNIFFFLKYTAWRRFFFCTAIKTSHRPKFWGDGIVWEPELLFYLTLVWNTTRYDYNLTIMKSPKLATDTIYPHIKKNENKNSAWLRVKTLSSSVLMYSYVPNK
jgi:hypothetical protein